MHDTFCAGRLAIPKHATLKAACGIVKQFSAIGAKRAAVTLVVAVPAAIHADYHFDRL
ncbi:MAG: hypothetical protein PHQ05_12380 [Sterolibacterium sp.]|nr:hypothetical protein [Sterolibacterium sp.]